MIHKIILFALLLLGFIPQASAQPPQGLTPCSSGISLSATNTSSNSQLSNCGAVVIVYNIGAVEAFLNWGTASTTAATTSGWSLPPGFGVALNAGRAPLYLAAITSSGSTTLRVVQGNGSPALAGGPGALGSTATVVLNPSSTAGAGNTPVVTGSLATSLVVKNSAGNLYGLNVSADSTLSGAAWWVMIHNAVAAPAAGAVTPTKCFALASGTTMLALAFPTPVRFGTGISVTVGTTGCFTQTDSAHAFISGDAQ